MTEEQKKRIRQAPEGDCDFDGVSVHPHFLNWIMKAGIKDLSEIEAMTEEDFIKKIDSVRTIPTKTSHGKTLTDHLKKEGVVFLEMIEFRRNKETGILEGWKGDKRVGAIYTMGDSIDR